MYLLFIYLGHNEKSQIKYLFIPLFPLGTQWRVCH